MCRRNAHTAKKKEPGIFVAVLPTFETSYIKYGHDLKIEVELDALTHVSFSVNYVAKKQDPIKRANFNE